MKMKSRSLSKIVFRKPNPGLLLEQSFLRNIDLKESLLIGDSERDLLAAKNAGCRFLHVNSL